MLLDASDVISTATGPGTDPDLDELADEISTMAAHLSAGTARWLDLVGEFDARGGWSDWGAKSCAHWVAWRCAMAPGAAREHVRVARALRELPLVREAFGRGELSFSKVRALTRVGSVQDEQGLVDLALETTAAQLERLVRAYRGVTAQEADRAAARRHLWLLTEDDGSVVVRGRLTAEDGALLRRALEAARDVLGVSAETPPHPADGAERHADDPDGAAAADALVHLADAFLAAPDGDAPERVGGDRHEVVVHVDAGALAADGPGAELQDGTPIAAEVARRITCDAAVVTLSERHGQTVSVGRRTRTIPPALRRALRRRDGACRFPGCTQRRWLDAHHIEHWAHGGATDLDNLVHLCRRHHRLLHEGGFTLSTGAGPHDPGALVFRDPDGRVLADSPPSRGGDSTALSARHAREGLSLDERTLAGRWLGDPLDLDLAVDALLTIRGPAQGSAPAGVSAETPTGCRGAGASASPRSAAAS